MGLRDESPLAWSWVWSSSSVMPDDEGLVVSISLMIA